MQAGNDDDDDDDDVDASMDTTPVSDASLTMTDVSSTMSAFMRTTKRRVLVRIALRCARASSFSSSSSSSRVTRARKLTRNDSFDVALHRLTC